MTESREKSSDELRSDVERTRERVSEDVEALGNKLSPENLKAEAKQAVSRTLHHGGEVLRDKLEEGSEQVREKLHEGSERVKQTLRQGSERVREGLSETESSVADFARRNPTALALIGAGVGLLIWEATKTRRNNAPDPAFVGRSAVYDGDGDADGNGSSLRERVEDKVSDARRTVSNGMRSARSKLHDWEGQAQHQAERTRDAIEQQLDERPLVLGAVALGAGLAVGLGLPSTESEDRLVGQYRDRLLDSAKQRASELTDSAAHALDSAKETAQRELREKAAAGP